MKTKAIFYGFFDPFTLVDMEVVKQALQKYDELIIMVQHDDNAKYFYTVDERLELVQEAVSELPDSDKISILSCPAFRIVENAIRKNATVSVRGIRPSTSDLQIETQQTIFCETSAALLGYKLTTEYIYVTDEFLQSVSSTTAKQMLSSFHFTLLAAMVPYNVYNSMMKNQFVSCIKEIFLHNDDQCIAKRMLQEAYSERGYHNLQHLGDMINMLYQYCMITTGKFIAKDYLDVLLAILWHDIIMEGDEKETAEEKSVKSLLHLAGEWTENINNDINREEIIGMIRATKLGFEATTEKQKLIADLDKAVLGTSFIPWWLRYNAGLRMEYWEVMDKEYLEGRIKFLRQLQNMDRIYQTDWFYQQFESQARRNIALAICRLKAELQALS